MSSTVNEEWDLFLIESKKTFEDRLQLEADTSMCLSDFLLMRTVGEGTFGTVLLARSTYEEEYYAIKILERARIVKLNQVANALNEKRMLLAINFTFIVSMKYFFKDNANIFFVLPFYNGGELFYYLRKFTKFNENLSMFYAAQVVLALEYLHYLNVIYRDLKPENVLLDKNGYIKITDLGFAKVVTTRTYTICGTPDYLAPEVVLFKGYSHSVDWWGLGVLIYEMVAGYPPFYASDTMKTYELISGGRYTMLPSFSANLRDLISKLLKVDTTQRIGSLKSGVSDIKNHRWFRGLSWMEVFHRRMKPPFVPKVTSSGDSSNFMEYSNLVIAESPVELFPEEFKDF